MKYHVSNKNTVKLVLVPIYDHIEEILLPTALRMLWKPLLMAEKPVKYLIVALSDFIRTLKIYDGKSRIALNPKSALIIGWFKKNYKCLDFKDTAQKDEGLRRIFIAIQIM